MIKVPCIVCGKPTASKYFVNFDAESQQVVPLFVVTPGSGLMPVGSECKKKFPKEFIWS